MTEPHPPVRGAIEFDSIRIYFGELMHLDIRRRSYRGCQTWLYDGNYIVEISLEGTEPMRLEYTEPARFSAVVRALQDLELNGE